LRAWAAEILEEMRGVCELLDRGTQSTPFTSALEAQQRKVADPELTPSARMLNEMRARGEGFYHFGKRMSEIHQHFFRNLPMSEARERFFREMAIKSLEDQRAWEAANETSFDDYLQRYFAQG